MLSIMIIDCGYILNCTLTLTMLCLITMYNSVQCSCSYIFAYIYITIYVYIFQQIDMYLPMFSISISALIAFFAQVILNLLVFFSDDLNQLICIHEIYYLPVFHNKN